MGASNQSVARLARVLVSPRFARFSPLPLLRPQEIVVGTSDSAMVQYSCDFNRGGLVRLMGGITYTAHTRGRLTVAGLVLYEIFTRHWGRSSPISC